MAARPASVARSARPPPRRCGSPRRRRHQQHLPPWGPLPQLLAPLPLLLTGGPPAVPAAAGCCWGPRCLQLGGSSWRRWRRLRVPQWPKSGARQSHMWCAACTMGPQGEAGVYWGSTNGFCGHNYGAARRGRGQLGQHQRVMCTQGAGRLAVACPCLARFPPGLCHLHAGHAGHAGAT